MRVQSHTATSQVANPELANLRDLAEQGQAGIEAFNFQLSENPYFTQESKEEFADALPEDQRLTRVEGIAAMRVWQIYDKFNIDGDSANGTGHGCEPFDVDPSIYSRWVILDPGLVRAAVLFVAIDPDEQFLTIYDGFATKGGATDCAARIKEREREFKFEGCVCDAVKGKERVSHITDVTVAMEYFKSLRIAGVDFRQLGPLNGFMPSCSDIEARTQSMRRIMEVRSVGPFKGTCKLQIVRDAIPELVRQVRRATADPKNPAKRLKLPKIPCDELDDAEYAAAFDPPYRAPAPMRVTGDKTPPALSAFRQKQADERKKASLMRRHTPA